MRLAKDAQHIICFEGFLAKNAHQVTFVNMLTIFAFNSALWKMQTDVHRWEARNNIFHRNSSRITMSPEVVYWFWERTTVNCLDKKGSPMITWTKRQLNTLWTVLFQRAQVFKERTCRSFTKWGSNILIVMKTYSTCYCGLRSQIEFSLHQKSLIFFSIAVSRVRYFVGDSAITARRRFDFSVFDVKIAGNWFFFFFF